jgi:hypothetical protein
VVIETHRSQWHLLSLPTIKIVDMLDLSTVLKIKCLKNLWLKLGSVKQHHQSQHIGTKSS